MEGSFLSRQANRSNKSRLTSTQFFDLHYLLATCFLSTINKIWWISVLPLPSLSLIPGCGLQKCCRACCCHLRPCCNEVGVGLKWMQYHCSKSDQLDISGVFFHSMTNRHHLGDPRRSMIWWKQTPGQSIKRIFLLSQSRAWQSFGCLCPHLTTPTLEKTDVGYWD